MACKGGTLKSGSDDYYPNAYYKVGDLFLTTRNENPSLRFGGTWELFGKGKTLVCVDDSDSDFKTVKKTGGEKTHTLTINEMPNHSHTEKYVGVNWFQHGTSGDWNVSSALEPYRETGSTGGDKPHNNLQPYITCYIWIRTE